MGVSGVLTPDLQSKMTARASFLAEIKSFNPPAKLKSAGTFYFYISILIVKHQFYNYLNYHTKSNSRSPILTVSPSFTPASTKASITPRFFKALWKYCKLSSSEKFTLAPTASIHEP